MNLRIWTINLLFAGLAIFIGLKAYDVWQSPNRLELPAIETDTPNEKKVRANTRRRMPPAKRYDEVVDKNLFSANRIETIPEEPATSPPPQETKIDDKKFKRVVVYGIIMSDDYRAALVSRPPNPKGGKANIWVREGDVIDNLRIEAIHRDEVVFFLDGVSHAISVYDSSEVKRRNLVAKAEGPTVISTTAKAKKPAPARVTKKKPRRPASTKRKPQTKTVTKQRPNTREKAQTGRSSDRARPTTGRSAGTPEQTSENLFQKLLQQRNP